MSDVYGSYSQEKEVSTLAPGKIHDNITLQKVEYFKGLSAAGKEYEKLNFFFVKETLKEKFMLIDSMLPLNKESMTTWNHVESLDKTFETEVINFNARIKHIATQFVTVEELTEATKGVTSFMDFCVKLANLLNPILATTNKKVYLKVGMSTSGYSEVPKYPKFIQSMDRDCTLVFTRKDNERLDKLKDSIPKADTVLDLSSDDDIDDIEDDEFDIS